MRAKKWSEVSRSDLAKLIGKMSGIEIAREFGVHHNAVYYRLRTQGIRNGKKRRRFDPAREELENLYRRMSMADMADHFGVGETVVFMRLKEHRIGGIDRAERLAGKPKTLAHRLAMSKSARVSGVRSGERNGNWKGGKSSDNKRARSRAAYADWKLAVLSAADWRCSACNVEHGSVCECCGHRMVVHAHHLKSFSGNETYRYEPSNGRALCERCHRLEHDKQTA